MAVPFLVVDMQRLMDESKVGKDAAASMVGTYEKSQSDHKKLLDKANAAVGKDKVAAQAKARQFEDDALKALKATQDKLRVALLKRAQPFVEDAVKATGAPLVLERGAVLLCDPALDITNQLIAKVDALGPLAG